LEEKAYTPSIELELNKNKIEQLYEDILGFYEDHDLELMNDKDKEAFYIVIGVLADYITHMEEE